MKPASVRVQDKTTLEFGSRKLFFTLLCFHVDYIIDSIDKNYQLDRLSMLCWIYRSD